MKFFLVFILLLVIINVVRYTSLIKLIEKDQDYKINGSEDIVYISFMIQSNDYSPVTIRKKDDLQFVYDLISEVSLKKDNRNQLIGHLAPRSQIILYVNTDVDKAGASIQISNETYLQEGDNVYEILDGYDHFKLYEFLKSYEIDEVN